MSKLVESIQTENWEEAANSEGRVALGWSSSESRGQISSARFRLMFSSLVCRVRGGLANMQNYRMWCLQSWRRKLDVPGDLSSVPCSYVTSESLRVLDISSVCMCINGAFEQPEKS